MLGRLRSPVCRTGRSGGGDGKLPAGGNGATGLFAVSVTAYWFTHATQVPCKQRSAGDIKAIVCWPAHANEPVGSNGLWRNVCPSDVSRYDCWPSERWRLTCSYWSQHFFWVEVRCTWLCGICLGLDQNSLGLRPGLTWAEIRTHLRPGLNWTWTSLDQPLCGVGLVAVVMLPAHLYFTTFTPSSLSSICAGVETCSDVGLRACLGYGR